MKEDYPNTYLLQTDLLPIPLRNKAVERFFCAETLPYPLEEVEAALKDR